MTAVKISAFGGMIPAQDDRLLPENNAALTRNCCLDSGALQGMHYLRNIRTLSNPSARSVFRIPLVLPDKNHLASSFWMEFLDEHTNVLRTPIANDSYERYYIVSPSTTPAYNTEARILNSDPNYTLGIPAPTVAPTVAPVGGVGVNVSRAYVYTWVSAYGEESAPSPPTLATNKIDATWGITMTAVGGVATGRNLTKVRIYRTVTGASGIASYFFVAEQAIATLTYNDTLPDTTVSAANALASTDYAEPPSDLEGIVAMPNGIIVGWHGNELCFCEPYLPHAWPLAYRISFPHSIVGLGVIGQTVMVLTEGYPYAVSGLHPANMAQSQIQTYEPCMARGSIVPTQLGVLYASHNGLVLAAAGQAANATASLVTKDKWNTLLAPETLFASRIGQGYYAWGTTGGGVFEPTAFETTAFVQTDYTGAFSGCYINLNDPRIAWGQLYNEVPVRNVITDVWTGETFIIRNGIVYWVDFTSVEFNEAYMWRSKIFQTDTFKNVGVVRLTFDEDSSISLTTRNVATVQTLANNQYGIIRAYADGNLVMTREMRASREVLRLPSGFTASQWQFEIEANVKVYSLEIAGSVKELARTNA